MAFKIFYHENALADLEGKQQSNLLVTSSSTSCFKFFLTSALP
jgi:hypothetical protein